MREMEAGLDAMVIDSGIAGGSDNGSGIDRVIDRVIGFDFGLKRIGVATGNTRTGTSQGLSVVRAKDGVPDWPEVERLLEQWLPSTVVVGLPVNMDDSENEMTAKARKFGKLMRRRFDLEVVFVDERLTTVGADQLLVEATAAGKSLNRKTPEIPR